jgi:hypothetical protein
MKEQNIDKCKIDSLSLATLLGRVVLKGRIEECVVISKDGRASVQAIDLTNSVFVSCSRKIEGLPDMKIGMSKLSIVTKCLSLGGDVLISIKDNKLTLKREGLGLIKLLLLDPAQIATSVKEEDAEKKICATQKVEFSIDNSVVEKFQTYNGLVSSDSTIVSVKNGQVTFHSRKTSEAQFSIVVATIKDEAAEMSTEVYTAYLMEVLSVLEFPKGKSCTIGLSDKGPILIKQAHQGTSLWALTPIAE